MNLKIGPLFLVAIISSNAFVNYENYKVYKIIPENEEQVHILNDLRKDGHYNFWTDIVNVGKHAKIMVQPSEHEEFEKYMSSIGMKPELSLSKVQELILAQMQPVSTSRINTLGSFDWNQYHTLDEIHNWLDELQELYSGIVRTVTAGKSHEGREIKGIIIDFRAGIRGLNPLVGMIEGGIHGGELISPAKITWIIKEFLTSNDANIRYIAEAVIWHIFPVINPDGYVNSFSNYKIAIRGAEKLKVKDGRHYEVGASANISYEVSGASFDWVKGVANAPIVHLSLLRDAGEYGFLLPSEEIITNNKKIMSRCVEINIVTKELRQYSGTSSVYRSLMFIAVNALLLVVVK